MMIGEQLSPILQEIENTLLEFEVNMGEQPCYTMEGFRAATKILMSALMDKMYSLQIAENIPHEDRCNMAEKCGQDLRKLISTYTGIDSHDLYTKPLIDKVALCPSCNSKDLFTVAIRHTKCRTCDQRWTD